MNKLLTVLPSKEKRKNFGGGKRSAPIAIVIGKWMGLNTADMAKTAHEPCFCAHSITLV